MLPAAPAMAPATDNDSGAVNSAVAVAPAAAVAAALPQAPSGPADMAKKEEPSSSSSSSLPLRPADHDGGAPQGAGGHASGEEAASLTDAEATSASEAAAAVDKVRGLCWLLGCGGGRAGCFGLGLRVCDALDTVPTTANAEGQNAFASSMRML